MNFWITEFERAAKYAKNGCNCGDDAAKKLSRARRQDDIKRALAGNEMTREELINLTGFNDATLYKDLVDMEFKGMVEGEKRGRFIYWRLSND